MEDIAEVVEISEVHEENIDATEECAMSTGTQMTPKKWHTKSVQARSPRKSFLQLQLRQSFQERARLADRLSDMQRQLDSYKKCTDRLLSVDNLKENPQLLKHYTGLPNFSTFLVIRKHVGTLYKRFNMYRVSLDEAILIVLVKMRKNLGNTMLGHLFGVSPATINNVLHSVVPKLARVLKAAIVNPRSDIVRQNLPSSFKFSKQFRRTRFIVDCTEIFIQRPKSLLARAQTYSHYKGTNTIKVLVACSPNGGITFLSKPWGGRISDVELIRRSGFYDLLVPGDHVLADRGFPIKEDLAARGVTLSIPAFTRGKRQLSGRSVESSAAIARVRIHVERAIGRIKQFKILTDRMPITLVPQFEHFQTIVGGLCNLLPPLVKIKGS